jgi:hypothetical protein
MKNTTIVYFHTGRGGRFYNAGFVTFKGVKNIKEVLSMQDSKFFLNYENEAEIRKTLEKKNLNNLIELFDKCNDKEDFTEFESKTGLEVGELFYTDGNGTKLISHEEAKTGIGCLNWDYEYNTDNCFYLQDCSEQELRLIFESDYWDKIDLLKQYFDDCTDLTIDWELFDTEIFLDLISDYFNNSNIDIQDFFLVTENN